MTTYTQLIERAMLSGGIEQRALAASVVDATLEMIADQLPAHDREIIRAWLPPRVASAVASRAHATGAGPFREELYEHVSVRARIPYRLAVELVGVACQALASVVDGDALVLLLRRLPESWAELFSERGPSGEVPLPPTGGGHTLATGRPGSHQPLSEAAPAWNVRLGR